MGIIILNVLFFIGLMILDIWYCKKSDMMKFIGVSIFLTTIKTSLLFLILIPKYGTITEHDYLSAIGAKTILETEQVLTQDNYDLMRISIKEINRYNEQRKDIERKHDRFWDGLFYSTKSLEKYPEIKIENMKIHKDDEKHKDCK